MADCFGMPCFGDKSVFNAVAYDYPAPGSSPLQPLGSGTSSFILAPSTANELGLGFEIKVMDRYDRRVYGRLAFSIFKTVFAPSFG